jgi:hypothetical protein
MVQKLLLYDTKHELEIYLEIIFFRYVIFKKGCMKIQ